MVCDANTTGKLLSKCQSCTN